MKQLISKAEYDIPAWLDEGTLSAPRGINPPYRHARSHTDFSTRPFQMRPT